MWLGVDLSMDKFKKRMSQSLVTYLRLNSLSTIGQHMHGHFIIPTLLTLGNRSNNMGCDKNP